MSAFHNARTPLRIAGISALLVGAGIVLAGPASAHVSISPGEGAAGEYTVATVSVPHGCDGSATTKVTIQVPEQLNSITPSRNALYDVTKKIEKLATPVKDAHGNEITERVAQIEYTAKSPLPDGYRDAFDLSFQVPDVAGTTIYFPTIQTCEKGSTAWVEIAAEGAEEPEHPAPAYKVLEATGEGDHAEKPAAETAAAPVKSEKDSNGLAIGGLAAGVIGLGLGGTALARTRRQA